MFKKTKFLKKLLNRVLNNKKILNINKFLWKKIVFNWEYLLDKLLKLSGFTDGNLIRIYTCGDSAFSQMIGAINSAKKQIWLETYQIQDDNIGNLIGKALSNASKKGVEVILIYDSLGSANLLSKKFIYKLKKSGVKVISFNPIIIWNRNHKKILLIDQKLAFCGGLNITNEYAGLKLGTNKFRDTLIKIKGPIIQDLSLSFLNTLNETTNKIRSEKKISYKKFHNGVFAQVLNSDKKKTYIIFKNL